MWSLRVTPIVGLPTYVEWSQAATFPLPSGKFVILLSVRGDSAAVFGQSILSELETLTPSTAQELHIFLTDLLEKSTEQAISVACLLQDGEKMSLGAVRANILLHRDSSTGRVLPNSDEVSLRFGKSKEDDVYILLNEHGEQFVPAIEQRFSQGLVAEAVATSLVSAVQSNTDKSGSAAIALVEVSSQATKEVAIVVDQTVPVEVEPEVSEVGPEVNNDQQQSAPDSVFRKFMGTSKYAGTQLWLLLRSFRFKQNTVYVRSTYSQWRRKVALLVATIVVLMLIIIGARWRYNMLQTTAKQEVAPLEERLGVARTTVAEDPIAARREAAQIVAELDVLANTKGKERFVGGIYTTALRSAQETLTSISGKVAVEELPVFYDLRLAQSEFVTSFSHFTNGKGVFIDAEKKHAIVLQLATKQITQFSLADITQVQASAASDDTLYLLGDGLWEIELNSEESPKQIKEVGDSNRAGTLLGSFGVYRYVLNPEKRNVFRYTQSAESVSDPIGWIIDPLSVSYEDITSLSIDGDIWFGTSAGEILRYASGRKQSFAVSGQEEAFANSLLLTTSADDKNLYVLDTDKQRLVILSKDGVFLREVRSPSIATVTSFFVDEVNGAAYLTSGSTVYMIALER
ncbi:MAG: hypothetical protein COU67_04270 [Candidatus Pacebacteria bacterium CG10_big_fil_rev_8_21_14_0_10_44_54]|nr:MAG: hypothetical protein COU67_04270 [Candidatus Pacebacteria bacterium CG10_big_fil_rev_8_21_14_0_10_44_54]